ncbi:MULTISPECIES: LytTR family DNA-binding domain-containing protein [Emticicia]|uniref:LytR/AlgR family response regulator transcription factor n=1 Tax=Emticicia TaxID=312278 RepID=UPI0007D89923|nr:MULTISPECIES: response regulator [Emticicia]
MQSQLKILIVEDEMLIAANIANQLETFGYEVIGIIPRGEEAIKVVQNDKPDLVLMDINLKGEIDGIETAKRIQQEGQIPIIYLTANSDDEHFNRAKATNPYAFLSKPFKRLDLQRALELASVRILQENNEPKTEQNGLKLEDRIFVKQNDLMCKILIADILYLEADRNYCQVFTKDKNYLLVNTLKNMEEKLPTQSFQRVHRSYIVNLKEINEFNHNNITVGNKILPLSKELRPELLARLQTI